MAVGVGSTTALTPLQRNFAGIKRYVANYVQGVGSSLLNLAGDSVNVGVDILNMYDFQWMVKTASNIATVANDRDYTSLPTDWKKPFILHKLDSSGNESGTLKFHPPHDFLHKWQNPGTSGTPTEYTVVNHVQSLELLLNVLPGSSWVSEYPNLKPRYYCRLSHFSDDNDTIGGLAAPPEAWAFLGWYGRWDVASTRGAASAQIDRAFAMWNRLLSQLRQNDNEDQADY